MTENIEQEKALATYSSLAPSAMEPGELSKQIALVQQVMRDNMKDGAHYGIIPGTGDKPTLYKAGADKLAFLFRLAPTFEIQRTDLPDDHREYQVICTLTQIHTGKVFAQGVGCGSTKEAKYRWRTDYLKDKEGKDRQVPRDYWIDRDARLLGPPGCQARKVKGIWLIVRRVENPDIADVYNTILKMAKKRAYVDATITATACSDIFTQDVEDLGPETEVEKPAAEPPPAAEKPAKAKEVPPRPKEAPPAARETPPNQDNGGSGSEAATSLVGLVSKYRPSEFEGKTFFWAEIGDSSVFTTDAQLGERLELAEGTQVEALVRAGRKPGRFILLDFHIAK